MESKPPPINDPVGAIIDCSKRLLLEEKLSKIYDF
jgi:hypothetical protein